MRPEEWINSGLNITQIFTMFETSFTVTADLYHTRFNNQFFPDYDSLAGAALIANYTGLSVSNGVQIELIAEISRRVEFRLAYNYLDV